MGRGAVNEGDAVRGGLGNLGQQILRPLNCEVTKPRSAENENDSVEKQKQKEKERMKEEEEEEDEDEECYRVCS